MPFDKSVNLSVNVRLSELVTLNRFKITLNGKEVALDLLDVISYCFFFVYQKAYSGKTDCYLQVYFNLVKSEFHSKLVFVLVKIIAGFFLFLSVPAYWSRYSRIRRGCVQIVNKKRFSPGIMLNCIYSYLIYAP